VPQKPAYAIVCCAQVASHAFSYVTPFPPQTGSLVVEQLHGPASSVQTPA
jgi:hypothetical protein